MPPQKKSYPPQKSLARYNLRPRKRPDPVHTTRDLQEARRISQSKRPTTGRCKRQLCPNCRSPLGDKVQRQKTARQVSSSGLVGGGEDNTSNLLDLRQVGQRGRFKASSVDAWLAKSRTELSSSNLAILQSSLKQNTPASEPSLTPAVDMAPKQSTTNDTRNTSSRVKSEAGKLAAVLSQHHANPEEKPSPDGLTQDLKLAIYPETGHELGYDSLDIMMKTAEDFLSRAKKVKRSHIPTQAFELIETYRQDVHDALSQVDQFTITRQAFHSAKEYCVYLNEAVLQRTVMISALDYWCLDTDLFAFDCEPRWKELPSSLPPSNAARLKLPIPDMSLSFASSAISQGRGSLYLPNDDFWKYISPDGRLTSYFPFLFIQAKKGEEGLQLAVADGTNCAVQALFNIRECFVKFEYNPKTLVEKVRTFSISLNANRVIARIHRIVYRNHELAFPYDVIFDKTDYNRDELSSLIRGILQQYAKKVLLPELQVLYQDLHGKLIGSIESVLKPSEMAYEEQVQNEQYGSMPNSGEVVSHSNSAAAS